MQIQGGNTANLQSTPFFDRDDAANGSAAVNRNSIDTTNAVRYRTAGNGAATDLTCNWWGADANPGYAGSAPWLTSNNLNGACIGGNPPTITIAATAMVKEGNSGNTAGSIGVLLDHTYPGTVTVHYATAVGGSVKKSGKATAGKDYVATAGTVTFPPNTTAASIPVTIKGDTTLEQNEMFLVNLSNPTNGMLTSSQSGIVTIGNDEFPSVKVKGGKIVTEGAVAKFTVTLKQSYWTTLNLTAATVANTAASPGDYIAVNTPLSFAAGTVGPKTVNVTTNLDGLNEPGEAFYLQVVSGSVAYKGQNKIRGNKT